MREKRIVRLAVLAAFCCAPLPTLAQQRMMKIGDEVVSLEDGKKFVRAQDLMSKKQFDQAATLLKALVEAEPKSSTIRFKYAFLLLEQGKNAEAFEQAKKCTELAPSFVGGWTILGESSFNLKQFPQAKDAYEKALAMQPKGENASVIKERLDEINKPVTNAPQLVEDPQATEQNRKSMTINQALSMCDKAMEYSKQKQFAQGLQECRAALKLAPDSERIKENFVAYLNNYAADCIQNQKLQEAETLMKEAVDFQAKGGVTNQTQRTSLKNYAALLNFLKRPDDAKKIETQMNALK
jgi:tetratricopeptide (TPR) repeat protein